MQTVAFKAGDTIISEGDEGDTAFFIVAGTVEVLIGQGAQARTVGTLTTGEVFGEMCLIDPGPRSATVKAVGDVECLAATYEEFIEAIEFHPERAVGFMKTLVRRLRQMNELLECAGPERRGFRELIQDCRKAVQPFEIDFERPRDVLDDAVVIALFGGRSRPDLPTNAAILARVAWGRTSGARLGPDGPMVALIAPAPALFQTNSAGTLKDETQEWRTFMRVSDVLRSNQQTLATCIPEESIASICTRLSALNIGAFPVCDVHGTLVGIISERDVVRAFAKDGARLADRHVHDLMTREVVTCPLDQTMLGAERLMHKHRVRHIPVMDGAKLVGMLSIRDIYVWRWQETRDEVNVLRDAMIAVRNR